MSGFEVTTGLITLKAVSSNVPVVDSDFEGKSAFFHVAILLGPKPLRVMLVHKGKSRIRLFDYLEKRGNFNSTYSCENVLSKKWSTSTICTTTM